MKPIIAKFMLFGDSANVLPILAKFLANYKKMVAALEMALARLQDSPSCKAAVAAKLEAANEALRGAAALGATYFRNEASRAEVAPCDVEGCEGVVYDGFEACPNCGAASVKGRQRGAKRERKAD